MVVGEETTLPKWRWGSMSFCSMICHGSITGNSNGEWRICSVSGSLCWSLLVVALWREPLIPRIRISTWCCWGRVRVMGRKGFMDNCLLLCLLRAFSQEHRLQESSKNLKELQVELLKCLVSPSLPSGIDSQTESGESLNRSYWQLLHFTFLMLKKN